jgi:hypothetical protein
MLPIGVSPRTQQVEKHGDEFKDRKKPVEQIEAAGAEIGAFQPPCAPAGAVVRGGAVDHPDEEAPEPRRDAEDAEADGAPDGLHAGGGLAVEELEQADEGGDVHHAQQEELRREPEHGHLGGGGAALGPAAALDCGSHGERHDVGREPDADPLQVRDAARVPCGAAQPRHDGAVVDHQDEHLEHDGDDEEARRRHVGGAEPGVHGPALLHRERQEQRDREVAQDGAHEDGKHPEDDLGLLHLRHRAQRPPPRVAVVHGRLVEEPFDSRAILISYVREVEGVISQSVHQRFLLDGAAGQGTMSHLPFGL